MNTLKPERRLAVVSALVEGSNIRSIERMTGVRWDTILRLVVQVGEGCLTLLDTRMRNLSCPKLQVDEIWNFVQKKQMQLSYEERFAQEIGDQYVFVALDADTKLVPWFEVGKRNMVTAYRSMGNLRERLPGRFQLTTDGFVPYIGAVDHPWGSEAPDFAQLLKRFGPIPPGPARYARAQIVEVVPTVVHGDPDPRHISTSYYRARNPDDPHGLPAVHAAH